MEGRITYWNPERGFGYVRNEGGTWFFHSSEIRGTQVDRGDVVDFLLVDSRRPDLGTLAAANVTLLRKAGV